MIDVNNLFENAILHWRNNKGVGTAIIPSTLDDRIIILGILQRMYLRSPTCKIVILTSTFKERMDIIEFITQQEDEENNAEFKQLIENKTLKIFGADYVKQHGAFMIPAVTILYHCDTLCDNIIRFLAQSKFKLIILNKLLSSAEDMNRLYSIAPILPDFKQNEINELRLNTPVEDIWIDINLPEDSDTFKLLAYYDEYITTSISIFGSFDVLQQARIGNTQLNISANQICAKIAQENGWNEHLDMSVELNIQLDELYNPGSLRDRAGQTYEIIRNRSQLLSDYEGKLDEILKIVQENSNDKILIISKRGEFASKITEYLNTLSEDIICGNYHDKAEPVPAIDLDGNPVFYKSGNKKGERKLMCYQAQKTRNEYLFNTGKIRVLSTNAAPDKELTINVDTIVITSPQCEDIKSYMYRLSNVSYPANKLKLYSIYIKNSLEQTKLLNKPLLNVHKIVNKCENNVINENNSDFILVD